MCVESILRRPTTILLSPWKALQSLELQGFFNYIVFSETVIFASVCIFISVRIFANSNSKSFFGRPIRMLPSTNVMDELLWNPGYAARSFLCKYSCF